MKAFFCISAFLALLGILCGCSTSSHIITGTARPAINPAVVKLYTSAPRNSEEVAVLTVESSGWTTQGEKDRAVAALKKQAAALGANGVLITTMGTESSGAIGNLNAQTGALWLGQSTYTAIRGVAIFVPSEQAGAPSSSGQIPVGRNSKMRIAPYVSV
jgi:hypothetical protein